MMSSSMKYCVLPHEDVLPNNDALNDSKSDYNELEPADGIEVPELADGDLSNLDFLLTLENPVLKGEVKGTLSDVMESLSVDELKAVLDDLRGKRR